MNLAQCIDAEWARQGFPVRFPKQRPANIPEQELRVVDRVEKQPVPQQRHRGGMSHRVLHLLISQARPMTVVALARFLPEGTDKAIIATTCKFLTDTRRVIRSGPRGQYAYTVTEFGRKYVE